MADGTARAGGGVPLLGSYPAAVAMVALVAWVRQTLDPALGEHHPFILFVAAIIPAAHCGGWKRGVLALLLSYVAADYLFLQPRHSLGIETVEHLIGLCFFLFVGTLSILLLETNRRRSTALTGANARLLREAAAREKAESDIRRLAMVVDSSSDAIVAKDLDNDITVWNKGAEALYGYAAAEIVGRPYALLLPPESQRAWDEAVGKVRLGDRAEPLETQRVRKDGSRVEVSLTVSPIWDGERVVGMSAVARDITERKRLEAELRQSAKMESVGRLAGGVAHDFNNLLTVINGYGEMLQDEIGEETVQGEWLGQICEAGKRAEKLTRQLLAYSRRQILETRVVDLNNVVVGMGRLLRPLLGEDIRVVTALDPSLARVQIDPTQIEQVVMNLAVNARDAMPRGGTLTLATANAVADARDTSKPSPHITLTVTDTGCGMDAATQEKIFEPFFTSKEVGQGTGLGLATVYGIVQQSGGTIEVESAPGRGSSFRIHLPAVTEAASVEAPADTDPLPQGSETVLLVEDDVLVRGFAGSMLRRSGYGVLEADGADAARLVCERHLGEIDLLLSDVVMPGAGVFKSPRISRGRTRR